MSFESVHQKVREVVCHDIPREISYKVGDLKYQNGGYSMSLANDYGQSKGDAILDLSVGIIGLALGVGIVYSLYRSKKNEKIADRWDENRSHDEVSGEWYDKHSYFRPKSFKDTFKFWTDDL